MNVRLRREAEPLKGRTDPGTAPGFMARPSFFIGRFDRADFTSTSRPRAVGAGTLAQLRDPAASPSPVNRFCDAVGMAPRPRQVSLPLSPVSIQALRSHLCAPIVICIDKQDETALCSVYLALAGGKNGLTLSYKAVLVAVLRKCCVITF